MRSPLTLYVAICLAGVACSVAAGPDLYGLIRLRNDANCTGAPSGCTALVSIAPETGKLTQVGKAAVQTLAAVGDLAVVDDKRGVYYWLGDGWNGTGTWLIGLSLTTGVEVCKIAIPSLDEVAIVGGGQSITHDTKNDRLIISGLATKDNGTTYFHQVFAASLDNLTSPMTKIGHFEYAQFLPVAHATDFDVEGQRLFITLSTAAHEFAMGVFDLAKGTLSTIPMTGTDEMWGMIYSTADKKLYSVAEGDEKVDWRSLDPTKEGAAAWTSQPLAFKEKVAPLRVVLGNLGSVRAYDPSTKSMYVLLSPTPDAEKIHLARIDLATGTVSTHPILNGDVGWSGSILLQLQSAGQVQH